MALDKLSVNDPRVEHHTVKVNGKNYHYILGNPSSGQPIDTIFLIHGWPDLGHGWRYQVPHLMALNYRVVVPDMLGYGKTDAPEALGEYAMKSVAADVAALAAHVVGPGAQIILGGHDWGGEVVWKTALWQPQLAKALFSVSTPFVPPGATWLSDEAFIKALPNFAYQLQLAGPHVSANLVGRDRLRNFLNGMYLGTGPDRETVFSTARGVLLDNLDVPIGQSPLMTREESEFYADEYNRHGIHYPLNWYRTRRINWEHERELVKVGRSRVSVPALMLVTTKDAALPPFMSAGMDKHFDALTKVDVPTHHWALVAAADTVNDHLTSFLAAFQARKQKEKL